MKKQKQSGFAHLMIIVVILTVALIGTLGFVFWQNFIKPKDNVAKVEVVPLTTKVETSSVVNKTFKSDKYNISFQYPGNWSLTNPNETVQSDFFYQSIDVENSNGEKVATFETGVQGLGGLAINKRTIPLLIPNPRLSNPQNTQVMEYYLRYQWC